MYTAGYLTYYLHIHGQEMHKLTIYQERKEKKKKKIGELVAEAMDQSVNRTL